MHILRFSAVFVMLFLVISPVVSSAEDTEGPVITNVEVVSSEQGDYDLEKPLLRYWNYSIGGKSEYPVGTVGSELIFTIQAVDELSGVKNVSIDIKAAGKIKTIPLNTDNNLTWYTGIALSDDDIGEFEIIKVSAEDNAGNINEVSPPNFKFYILPRNYQLYNEQPIGVTDTHNKIKISFSEEMDVNTLNTKNIIFLESTTQRPHYVKVLNDYNIYISEDKKSIIIYRQNNFFENRNYIVIIHESVRDIIGNPLENPMYINLKYIKSNPDTPPSDGGSIIITQVPYINPDYSGTASKLLVNMKKKPPLKAGEQFRLLLPYGVSWGDFYQHTGEIGNLVYTRIDNRTLQFETKNETSEFEIPLNIRLEGALGEILVTIDARDSSMTSGQYVIAKVGFSQW